jgi:hypothetical protein
MFCTSIAKSSSALLTGGCIWHGRRIKSACKIGIGNGTGFELHPLRRKITLNTVRHLDIFHHVSGYGYGFGFTLLLGFDSLDVFNLLPLGVLLAQLLGGFGLLGYQSLTTFSPSCLVRPQAPRRQANSEYREAYQVWG